MTRVKVNPGICGFSVTVTAEKGREKKVLISLDTDCEMVQKMLEDISSLDMLAAFMAHVHNPVYKSASKHLKHPACPVPSAILKAVEVELGMNLPKNVTLEFLRD